jgi:alkylhydroperoxidase/carboxymuconolactone decarboxylase family protein YurZ
MAGDAAGCVIELESMSEHEQHPDALRRLSIRDDAYVDLLLADEEARAKLSCLDGRARALVHLAALVAVDAAPPSYMEAITSAREWGASSDEIAGCLIAILPAVGVARVVSAAPKVALALGYDVNDALEAYN